MIPYQGAILSWNCSEKEIGSFITTKHSKLDVIYLFKRIKYSIGEIKTDGKIT